MTATANRRSRPDSEFTYAFTVRNRAGLYWYHPHPHGITAGQVRRGLLGLFMVEDADEFALRRALALVPGETEIPLLLTDRRTQRDRSVQPCPRPTCCMDGTATKRWSISRRARFATSPPASIGCACSTGRTRAFSGWDSPAMAAVRCRSCSSAPTAASSSDPFKVTEVFVAPAERVDLLVDFAGLPVGSFVLLDSRAFDPMHAELAPRRRTEPSAGTADHGTEIAPGSAMAASHSDGGAFALLQFRIRERGGRAATVPERLSTMPAIRPSPGDDRPLRLGFAKGRWRINDLVYDAGATPIVVVRNTVETWLIRNYHTSMPHAMHLHGFQFRVLGRETSPEQLSPLVVDGNGRLATDLGQKDTILVWPGESVKIAIDFAHPFAGSQIYLFHCHNLEHEDGGMMLRVQVG